MKRNARRARVGALARLSSDMAAGVLVALLVLLAPAAPAAEIRCLGVLGNSGEQGDSLVRFGPVGSHDSGLGVVCDRYGSLWDRGGRETLNRYAPDGRLLAQYRIPEGSGNWNGQDKIALVGDTIVMKLGNRLLTLPVDAKPGESARDLGVEAERMSFASHEGRVAAYGKGELFLVDPATGERKALARIKGAHWLEMGPDGAVYPVIDWKLAKFVGGEPVTDGWPRDTPGERPQLLGEWWYGHAWHGTVKRFDAELQPAPGVVLGGASGSFIGHLAQNSELVKGSGLTKVREDLYAISGIGGVMHLMEWRPSARQMVLVRRIGAVPNCRGLGLDREGNVWYHAGNWRWDDPPDAPLRNGVNSPEHPGVCQAVMLKSDCMVAPGRLWGKPTFYRGRLSGEVASDRREGGCALRRDAVASAAYRRDGKLCVLVIGADGKGNAFNVASDGRYEGEAGPVELKGASGPGGYTSLAMKDEDTLLAAAGGAVIELARDGANWRESREWSSWGGGDDERFGARVFIAADSGRLWVSDTERHRVLVFDLASGREVAGFGRAGAKGADLASLDGPGVLAARGPRGVVFDGGNQRLVKLEIR